MALVDQIWDFVKEKTDNLRGTDLQKKIKNLTSSSSYGINTHEKQVIAQATYDFQNNREIMDIIWDRISPENHSWKVIMKSLSLLEDLFRLGSEKVIQDARNHQYLIQRLHNYSVREDNREYGQGIRDISKKLDDLLDNPDQLKILREDTQKNQNKYGQSISSDGMSYGSSYDMNHDYDWNPNKQYGGFGSDSITFDNLEEDAKKSKHSTPKKSKKKKDKIVPVMPPSDSENSKSDKEPEPIHEHKKDKKKKKHSSKHKVVKEKDLFLSSANPIPTNNVINDDFDPRKPVSVTNNQPSQQKSTIDDNDWQSFQGTSFDSQPPPSTNVDSFFSEPSQAPAKDDFFDIFNSVPSIQTNPTPMSFSTPQGPPITTYNQPQPQVDIFSQKPILPQTQPQTQVDIFSSSQSTNINQPAKEPKSITPDKNMPTNKPEEKKKNIDLCWDSDLVNLSQLGISEKEQKAIDKKKQEQRERDYMGMNLLHRPVSMNPPPLYGYPNMNMQHPNMNMQHPPLHQQMPGYGYPQAPMNPMYGYMSQPAPGPGPYNMRPL